MRIVCLFFLFISIQILNGQSTIPHSLLGVEWSQDTIAEGLYFGQMQFDDLFESKQSVSVLQVDLSKSIHAAFVYSDTNRITSEMASGAEALAAVNGSFFDMKNGGGVKYLKSDGNLVHRSKASTYTFWDSGAVAIDQDGFVRLIKAPEDLDWTVFNEDEQYPDIMVSGPWILLEGEEADIEPVSFNTNRHPRTFACTTKDKQLKLVTVDGRNPEAQGMSIAELQILSSSMDCVDALNLDGGGSTTMWLSEYGVVNHPSDNGQFDDAGERPCANIIAILASKSN